MNVLQITPTVNRMVNLVYFKKSSNSYKPLRELLKSHLKLLSNDDRYLRFFSAQSDDSIDIYVNKINFKTDGIFIVLNETYDQVIGFLHASRLDGVSGVEYEIGVSVNESARGMGVGYELFAKAVSWTESLGGKRLYVNCLTQNKAMQKIAEKFKLKTHSIDYDTREGELTLNSIPNLFTYMIHFTANNIMVYDALVRKRIQDSMKAIYFSPNQ